MDRVLTAIRDILIVWGPIVAALALFRQVYDARYQRDAKRIEYVKSLINEQQLAYLQERVYADRRVPRKYFYPFDQLYEERRSNQDSVRFTGPLAKQLAQQLDELIAAYLRLREFIQVNEWEPECLKSEDGDEEWVWEFNKAAFNDEHGIPRNYASHLDNAAAEAVSMYKAFQRFQMVAEVHLYEAPLAKWILPRRFRQHGLEAAK